MLEIKITAPEIFEAINSLARAIGLAVTNLGGTPTGVLPTSTTYVVAEPQTEPQQFATAPVETVVSPAAPAPDANNSTPATTTVPTAAPQYTLEMIAKAGTALIDAGKMGELTALLAKYGVEALTTLDPAHYGTFATELRALGAAI